MRVKELKLETFDLNCHFDTVLDLKTLIFYFESSNLKEMTINVILKLLIP